MNKAWNSSTNENRATYLTSKNHALHMHHCRMGQWKTNPDFTTGDGTWWKNPIQIMAFQKEVFGGVDWFLVGLNWAQQTCANIGSAMIVDSFIVLHGVDVSYAGNRSKRTDKSRSTHHILANGSVGWFENPGIAKETIWTTSKIKV